MIPLFGPPCISILFSHKITCIECDAPGDIDPYVNAYTVGLGLAKSFTSNETPPACMHRCSCWNQRMRFVIDNLTFGLVMSAYITVCILYRRLGWIVRQKRPQCDLSLMCVLYKYRPTSGAGFQHVHELRLHLIQWCQICQWNKFASSLVPRLSTWRYPQPQLGHLQLSIDICCPRPAAGCDKRQMSSKGTNRQTDKRTPDGNIDPAPHTMLTASVRHQTLRELYRTI